MLPAVKVFAVATLLGGGAVGTFALAGGFGPGGNGSGNEKATTQVAAVKPTSSVPGVAPAVPETKTPQAAEVARSSEDSALESIVQQREEVSSVDQAPQQAVHQINSQSQTEDSSSGNQAADAVGKAELGDASQDTTPSRAQPESQVTKGSEEVQSGDQGQSIKSQSLAVDGASRDQGTAEGVKAEPTAVDNSEVSTPVAKPTTQQESAVVVSSENTEERGAGSGSTGDSGVVKNTEQTITSVPVGSDAGNKGNDLGGTGTDGADTITTSGEEETRTASGEES